jgi:serine/threonine protein kinase
MGEVYAAFDERLEREVALKVLSEDGDVGLQKKRLFREARLAAKLTHPNIATIYEVDELEGRLYIVMELLEGLSLRKILTHRKMSVDEAIAVARDVARALGRAHSGGVIHRDIKPENVFVTSPSPDALLAKVLDFGLARQRPDGVTVAEQTYTVSRGDMWGTPGYVSPEQAHGQMVDVRTDLFSFGVIFYEMLAGIKPFRADTAIGIMLATTRTEPRPLREIAPQVPPAIDEVVWRCLRKDRDERYADGNELSAMLEAFVRSNPRPNAPGAVVGGNIGRISEPESGTLVLVPNLDSESRTTGPTEVVPNRSQELQSLEVQRREHMKLVAAIGSGVAIALVVVVVLLAWLAPSRRPKTAIADPTPSAVVASPATALEPTPSAPIASATAIATPTATASVVASAAAAPAVPAVEPAEALEPGEAPPPPIASVAATVAPTPTLAPTAGRPASVASSRPRKKPADCVEPFKVDAKGVKIPKLYCL